MRPIDADELAKKAYWHGEHPDVSNPFAEGVDAVDMSDIDNTPTLDVEPVRHGEWVFKYPNGWACSECGTWGLKTDQLGICKSKYCPECGAIMDVPS